MDYVDMFLIHWPMAMQVWNPDTHEHKRLSDTIYIKINCISTCVKEVLQLEIMIFSFAANPGNLSQRREWQNNL